MIKHEEEKKNIDIIVVNWNSGNKTLSAVQPYTGYCSDSICCNIIVVDNASSDNSICVLKDRVDSLIENNKNEGFAKACNQAMEKCTGQYILLLNPDTKSDAQVLENLVNLLDSNPKYAITGPQQLNEQGNILTSCGRFPTFLTAFYEIIGLSKLFPHIFTPSPIMIEWDHKQDRIVDHVIGSYYLIKRSVIDKIGFMDNRFFLYMEDLDLSKRVKDAGYFSYYSADNRIFHESGGSGERIMAGRMFYSLISRKDYWRKHFGSFRSLILTILMVTIEPPMRIINLLTGNSIISFKEIVRAYFLFLKFLIQGRGFRQLRK